jgi:hypothetical protein
MVQGNHVCFHICSNNFRTTTWRILTFRGADAFFNWITLNSFDCIGKVVSEVSSNSLLCYHGRRGIRLIQVRSDYSEFSYCLNKCIINIFFCSPTHFFAETYSFIIWRKSRTIIRWSLSPVSIASISSKTLNYLSTGDIHVSYSGSIELIKRLITSLVNPKNVWERLVICSFVVKRI